MKLLHVTDVSHSTLNTEIVFVTFLIIDGRAKYYEYVFACDRLFVEFSFLV